MCITHQIPKELSALNSWYLGLTQAVKTLLCRRWNSL